MAKKITKKVKLQLHAGKATPAPPVGTALGPTGINMQEFCIQFNDMTREKGATVIPVIVTIYDDRSFSLQLKTPPASILILQKIGIAKGSGVPNKTKVGTLTWDQCKEIATEKMPDLNANDVENGARIIAGTARNMGVEVSGMPAQPMISGILAMIILCSLFVLVLFVFAMAISHEDKLSVLKGVYIYVVSIISLGVFLIGLGMGIYNLLGQYVFPKAIDAEYKYILQECDRGYMTEPVKVDKTGTGTMLDNQTSIQDKVKCEEEKRARIEEEKEIDFSRNMLTAFIFILIGLPIYLLHFFYFRKNI